MEIKEHYFELMDYLAELFCFIFDELEHRYSKELKQINE